MNLSKNMESSRLQSINTKGFEDSLTVSVTIIGEDRISSEVTMSFSPLRVTIYRLLTKSVFPLVYNVTVKVRDSSRTGRLSLLFLDF